MNPDTDKSLDQIEKLIQEYPVVFKHMDTTSYNNLPAGWYSIVDTLCSDLTQILEEELAINPEIPDEPLFSVLQVKEKFGGLRFYYMMNTDNKEFSEKVMRLIDGAEDASYVTCQITGKPGVLCKSGSWYMTLCEESRISMGYKIIGNG